VEADEAGIPTRLRLHGVCQNVSQARRPWRVDQHWWRAESVKRIYYRLDMRDGPPLTIYYDAVAQTWLRQEY
jgi:hypothetical protein